MPSFLERLHAAEQHAGSCLCIGLDPDPDRLPISLRHLSVPEAILAFNREIIAATAPFAAAYKPNAAFYEAHGLRGIEVLYETVALIRNLAPHALVVADSKRGDIGNTAAFYARAAFDDLGADALTVAPYMGADSVTPFLAWPDRAVFVLARTSNPGARDFQHLQLDGVPLYHHVATRVQAWDAETPGTAGLVVGATDVESLRELRRIAPALPFLIPGVGAQGGDPESVLAAAGAGGAPLLVNSSRSILYASDQRDFANAAGEEARRLSKQLARSRTNVD